MPQTVSLEYYGVFVPLEYRNGQPENEFVFHIKQDALARAKFCKKARFKAFSTYADAIQFAESGSEIPKNSNGDNDVCSKDVLVGEKQSPFKAPKSQELVKFRKSIETGDIDRVSQILWENPRYLVSSGDTPSILQEGSRYNALHIAAKARNHEICDLILRSISKKSFIKLLYGDSNYDEELAKDRIRVLVDLYLNTPDKGLNETPLHFAVKFGATEVVQVLMSYPQCDKTLKNKYGKTPDMIICDRCDNGEAARRRRAIALLLEGYYVPVLHAEDNSTAPTIGLPFSPSSPPVLNKDPLSPRLEIRAYAGPLNRKEAEQFRRVWKTPPRTAVKESDNCKAASPVDSLRYKDHEKGLERIGKTLASKFDIGWKEYWPFLDSFVDIASKEGSELFEKYLLAKIKKYENANEDMKELTSLFEGWSLKDNQEILENNFTNPHLCLERACQVYATRLSNCILQTANLMSNIEPVLEKEIVQIQYLMRSYLNDSRFRAINFQSIHSRLGKLISQKIHESIDDSSISLVTIKLEEVKDKFVDDGSVCVNGDSSPTTLNGAKSEMFVTCLLTQILTSMKQMTKSVSPTSTEDECAKLWNNSEECECILQPEAKGFVRNHSFKNKFSSQYFSNTSRKLDFNDSLDGENENLEKSLEYEDDDDDDQFYTPPSTPEPYDSDDSSSDDLNYEDASILLEDIFINGDEPTKTDCAVYDAFIYSNSIPDRNQFPNVFKWYHAVSLYSDLERHSWQNPSKKTSTPDRFTDEHSFMNGHYKSWLNVTGVNSPKASFKNQHL